MPLYNKTVYTDTGTKTSVNLDPSIAPFNASVVCSISNAANYKLQYSLDPMDVSDASATWVDSANIPSGTTATSITNFMFPVARVRVVIASLTGTLTLQVRQGYTNN